MFLWQYLTPLLLLTLQICKALDCEEFTDLSFKHAFIGTSLKIKLLLYTREHEQCGIRMSHTNLSETPHFNASRPTTFIIHGYRPTGSPPVWMKDFSQQLLERQDMNVIVVDWNRGAANVNYVKAVENTRKTAEHVIALIKVIQEHGVSLASIHLIGISLGAHISGFVGANFKGEIGRITALDPAGPLFTGKPPEDRLDPSDAQFVDALHTDIDALGFRQALGHIDYYANGGTDQPGCPLTIFGGGSYFKCDHQRSVLLYMESVSRTCKSIVYPCSSYKDFLDGKCSSCSRFGPAGCPIFGYDAIQWKDTLRSLNQTKTYFKTNADAPFCMTNYFVEVVTWNQEVRYAYITIKLQSGNKEAVANIDHNATRFKKFIETRMLAPFNAGVQSVDKISLTFTTGNVFKPSYKLRVLRLRLVPLESKERPLCRYDFVLEEKKTLSFRPIPCEDKNF